MGKQYRGICPLCKREDVLLISKNGECHRCYKRTGLGQDPLATKREMPSPRTPTAKKYNVCKVDGCDKHTSKLGYCWSHCKSVAGVNPATGEALKVQVEELASCEECGVIPCSCFEDAVEPAWVKLEEVIEPIIESPAPGLVMSEMDMELDQLFKAKRTAWLYDLANATTIRSRAKMFLSMSDSLEGMVY